MAPTVEEIARNTQGTSSKWAHNPEILANIQQHFNNHNLDPMDTIYFESGYFTDLYNLGPQELVDYAHQLDMYLEYSPRSFVDYFKILRTVIYYIDTWVQQALLDYHIPNIECRNVNEAGDIMDPISQAEVNPRRMMVIPVTEPDRRGRAGEGAEGGREVGAEGGRGREAGDCYDIISYYNRSDGTDIDYPTREVNNLITEKAWWVAYREDFNQNRPFIPDKENPHKYMNLYQYTNDMLQVLNQSSIAAVLDGEGEKSSSSMVDFVINNVDIDEILLNVKTRGGGVNQSFMDGYTLLHLVVRYSRGNTQTKIRRLLAAGADLNVVDNQGTTVLMVAAIWARREAIALLFEMGSAVNIQNSQGNTALILASTHGSIEKVELIVNQGADLNIQNNQGETALWVAVNSRNIKVIELLLDRNVDPNIKNKDGIPALILAMNRNYFQVLKLLIDAGADLNVQDANGKTALMLAIAKKHPAFPIKRRPYVELLIDAGADPNIQDMNGITALMLAIMREAYVELLIDAGADPNIQDATGATALMLAVNYVKYMKLLIAAGADPNIQNNKGVTALMLLNMINNRDGLQILLAAGADLDIQNAYGDTVLTMAVAGRLINKVIKLLKVGANPNVANKYQETPIFSAARRLDKQMVQLLLEADANINYENSEGSTALFYFTFDYLDSGIPITSRLNDIDVHHVNNKGQTALFTVSFEIAKFLLNKGADIHHQDNDGKNALFYSTDSVDKIKLLIEHGIDVNHQDNEGKTVGQTVKKRKDIEILDELGIPVPAELVDWTYHDKKFFNRLVKKKNHSDLFIRDVRENYIGMSDTYSWRLARWALANIINIKKCCSDVKEYTRHCDETINHIIRYHERPPESEEGSEGGPWTEKSYPVLIDMYRALEETIPLPEDTIMYRGLKPYEDMTFDKIKIGDTLDMKGFSSFSIDIQVAKRFAETPDDYVLKTIYPTGLKALFLDLGFDTSYFNEREILTYPNLQFEVVAKYIEEATYIVEARLVLPAGEQSINKLIAEVETLPAPAAPSVASEVPMAPAASAAPVNS